MMSCNYPHLVEQRTLKHSCLTSQVFSFIDILKVLGYTRKYEYHNVGLLFQSKWTIQFCDLQA